MTPSTPYPEVPGLGPMTEEHRRHLFEGEPDEDLIQGLEPDQLVEAMHLELPRAHVGTALNVGLWVLRIVLVVLTAMAVFSFVAGIHKG